MLTMIICFFFKSTEIIWISVLFRIYWGLIWSVLEQMWHSKQNHYFHREIANRITFPSSWHNLSIYFYCCISNHCKPSSLKQHIFCICLLESGICLWLSWVLCSRSHKAAMEILAGLCSHLEARMRRVCFSFRLFAKIIYLT